MKTKEESIQEITNKLQENCHLTVEAMINANKKSQSLSVEGLYQDAVNTWMFFQLATLSYEIQELKATIQKQSGKSV